MASKYGELDISEIRILLSTKEKTFSGMLHGPANPFGSAYSEAEYEKLKMVLAEITELLDAMQALKVEAIPE